MSRWWGFLVPPPCSARYIPGYTFFHLFLLLSAAFINLNIPSLIPRYTPSILSATVLVILVLLISYNNTYSADSVHTRTPRGREPLRSLQRLCLPWYPLPFAAEGQRKLSTPNVCRLPSLDPFVALKAERSSLRHFGQSWYANQKSSASWYALQSTTVEAF